MNDMAELRAYRTLERGGIRLVDLEELKRIHGTILTDPAEARRLLGNELVRVGASNG